MVWLFMKSEEAEENIKKAPDEALKAMIKKELGLLKEQVERNKSLRFSLHMEELKLEESDLKREIEKLEK